MKKLKLRALELGAVELLTRTQLKNVYGGYEGDSCFTSSGCSTSSCTVSSGTCKGVSGTCGVCGSSCCCGAVC